MMSESGRWVCGCCIGVRIPCPASSYTAFPHTRTVICMLSHLLSQLSHMLMQLSDLTRGRDLRSGAASSSAAGAAEAR